MSRTSSASRIFVCSTALDNEECRLATNLLSSYGNSTADRVLFVMEKVEKIPDIKFRNINAGYPASLLDFLNNDRAAFPRRNRRSRIFRDAIDLECLLTLQDRNDFSASILLRGGFVDLKHVAEWLENGPQQPFFFFGNEGDVAPALAFSFLCQGAEPFAAVVRDQYSSGAAYAVSPYRMEYVFHEAWSLLISSHPQLIKDR